MKIAINHPQQFLLPVERADIDIMGCYFLVLEFAISVVYLMQISINHRQYFVSLVDCIIIVILRRNHIVLQLTMYYQDISLHI